MHLKFFYKNPGYFISLIVLLLITVPLSAQANEKGLAFFDRQISQHKNASGLLVLEKGEQALLTRAWLADHAQKSIEVQYFIWSTDNIGILASEALLRAAERGVNIKVIVDDLLIDAPDESLIALSMHPKVDVRIYNPKHSVGTSFFRRMMNVFTDFRGSNQRMHDKTFIVDGKVAITGGRNMADEYFDYDQKYNFRDRDALVIGEVVKDIQKSFYKFWGSSLSVPVQERFDDEELKIDNKTVKKIYRELHQYAQSPENFEVEVKNAIKNISTSFKLLARDIEWGRVEFISDEPGKNTVVGSFDSGGKSTSALASLIEKAKTSILIQSPYLVLSDKAEKLFQQAIKRGVKITISTNSLASTDNLQAFSGYRNQRDDILESGIRVFEYKPFPKIRHQLLIRYPRLKDNHPVFALHAKTMVIDSTVLYIGTYNLDPRSENLNTEVGVVMNNTRLAHDVIKEIETDMHKDNSWNALNEPDQHATFAKRLKVFFYQLLPLKPVL